MRNFGRRHFLAAATVVPLAGCTPQPAPEPAPPSSPTAGTPTPRTTTPTPTPTAAHPLGLTLPSSVEAVIFDGAFGLGYVRDAAALARDTNEGLRVQVRSSDNITHDVGPRFDDGATPPDLIDNSGANQLAVAEIADALLPLDDLLAASNLEGYPVEEILYSNVVEAGTFNGRFVALNYALSVYGLWHSATDFAAMGWSVPVAWDEMLFLGEEVRDNGQALFVWGDEAAAYYAELAIASAIKEGGAGVRRALDNLEPEGWQHPAVAGVLDALATCVEEGFILHGGSFLEAQARWSMQREALFYPSGSWLPQEMRTDIAEDFEMTVAPVPTLTAAPVLPRTAVHAQAIEQFIVPRDAANPEGGLELLRVMLSREVAEEFARINEMPTVVRTTVPSDLESTALAAQTRMLADAGDDVFGWRFIAHYGLGDDYNRLWAQFLHGQLGALALAEQLQALSDAVREDASVDKYTVD